MRTFTQMSRAWYCDCITPRSDKVEEEFMVGRYEGDKQYEFGIRFHRFGDGELCARVEVYHSAFYAFQDCSDLFDRLAVNDDGRITPEDVRFILVDCGFCDRTPTERPF